MALCLISWSRAMEAAQNSGGFAQSSSVGATGSGSVQHSWSRQSSLHDSEPQRSISPMHLSSHSKTTAAAAAAPDLCKDASSHLVCSLQQAYVCMSVKHCVQMMDSSQKFIDFPRISVRMREHPDHLIWAFKISSVGP